MYSCKDQDLALPMLEPTNLRLIVGVLKYGFIISVVSQFIS